MKQSIEGPNWCLTHNLGIKIAFWSKKILGIMPPNSFTSNVTLLIICKHISMLEKMGLYLAIVLSSRWTTNSAPIGKTKLTKVFIIQQFLFKGKTPPRKSKYMIIYILFMFVICLSVHNDWFIKAVIWGFKPSVPNIHW